MSLSHVLRKSIARLLIGVVLFAQFAVAGYVCPGLQDRGSMTNGRTAKAMLAATADAAFAAQAAAMPPGCEQMDAGAANLCAAHCQQGQQGVDTTAAPIVELGIPTFWYSLPIEPEHSLGSGRSSPALDARLEAAPEPPHAILHCVFRI